jgi:hypothetical protein
MKPVQHPSILAPLRLPTHCSATQAAAVFEMLDELINGLWAQYGTQIQRELRKDRAGASAHANLDEADVPF